MAANPSRTPPIARRPASPESARTRPPASIGISIRFAWPLATEPKTGGYRPAARASARRRLARAGSQPWAQPIQIATVSPKTAIEMPMKRFRLTENGNMANGTMKIANGSGYE